MKYRLIDLLCCPQCNGALELKTYMMRPSGQVTAVASAEQPRCSRLCARFQHHPSQTSPEECSRCYQDEIVEGHLTCNDCKIAYPIINNIPRLLPPALLAESLAHYHSDFLKRHHKDFPSMQIPISHEKKKVATLHAFSYQWTTFLKNFDYFSDIFLSFTHPFVKQEDFKGKIVLEIGCGSGRPASIACSFGAEVVAVDLSEAVESAQQMASHYPMLHVVQADAYALPFHSNLEVDFVYSVGVIQHLPNPHEGLQGIARLVKPGRRIIIWVYGIREFWYRPIDLLRKLTVRLPFRFLHVFSYILAVFSELFLLIPYRLLSKIPYMHTLAEKIPGRIYARFPFKENVLGWFDRLGAPVTCYFSRDQVENMLLAAGFSSIQVVARPGASASWVAQGIRVVNHESPGKADLA
jgi:uncharacterized protein YbaR (Trm112 family)/ubiquinone/menaquinone biosynthesis C-methylase UbiE